MKKIALLLFVILNYGGESIMAKNLAVDNTTKDYIPIIIPPSPEAYKFSTFGNIPLNGSTGGFSYSIPIYTIQDKDITMPISVDYYSSGVKIDELSGIVGTGWTLNVGGVISRVMRGYPDEDFERWYPDYINPSTDDIKKRLYSIGGGFSLTDIERDWFSFNVNGISGSFYFDENLNPIVNSKEYVKVTFQRINDITSFTITDNKGYIYVFGGGEAFIEKTIASSSNGAGFKDKYDSSWFLKDIISPNQNKISFTYEDNPISFNSGTSFSLIYDQDCICTDVVSISYSSKYNASVLYNTTSSKALSQITLSNGKVSFAYNSQRSDEGGLSLKEITIQNNDEIIKRAEFNYEMTFKNQTHSYDKLKTDNSIKYRMFLQNVILSNSVSDLSEKYSFEYYEKEQLPIRLSFSKDKYGYNNGSNNTSAFSSSLQNDPEIYPLLSKYNGLSYVSANNEVNPDVVYYGMLKKIVYPTGGNTQIKYEANASTAMGTEMIYKSGSIQVLKDCSDQSVNEKSFVFTSNGTPLNFRAGASLMTTPDCVPSSDPLHDKYSLTITNLTTGVVIASLNRTYGQNIETNSILASTSGSSNYDGSSPLTTVKDNKYEVSLKLLSKIFNPAQGNVSVKYNSEAIPVEKTVYAGGARVKSIADYNTEGGEYNKRSFYYNTFSQYPSLKTSLIDIAAPRYYNFMTYTKSCMQECSSGSGDPFPTIPPQGISYKKYVLSSSSFTSLYNNRKQQVYYTQITEFVNNTSTNNGIIERGFYNINDYKPNPIWGPEIEGAPYSNGGDAYYGILKTQKIYSYNQNQYSMIKSSKYDYILGSSQLLSSYVLRKNSEIPNMVPIGDYGTYIENLSLTLYYNHIGYARMANAVDSTFIQNQCLVTKTDYAYSGSPYFNLKKETTTNSDGSTQIKNYQYSPDLTGQLSNMDKLVTNNRVGIPITTESKTKNTAGTELQTTFTKTAYQEKSFTKSNGTSVNLLLPESIYTPTSTDKRITFTNYDEFGNIIYYILDDATKVVYLWGYNGQYPIAEIKNATYDQVKAALGVAPESLSSAAIPDYIKIEALRTNTNLLNALITTYTYKPLIGILTATDPRGVVTSYEYDSFNRLSGIKDANGKLINTYDYHYQNQ